MEQTTPTIRLTFRVVVTHYTKVTFPLVSRWNLLVRLRFRHADFKRLRVIDLSCKRLTVVVACLLLWARALCFSWPRDSLP